MASTSNRKRASSRKKPNPVATSNRVPPRVKINFDGQLLHGIQHMGPMNTLVNQAVSCYLVDCSNTSTTGTTANYYIQGCTTDLNGIVSMYNEYIFRSVKFEWIPFVAPGVADGASQMYISYVDNAEVIGTASSIANSVANLFNLAKNAKNSKYFNAWERFTYNVPLSSRRKTFDSNKNLTTGTSGTDQIDRSTQGAVLVGSNSLSAAVPLGQWRVEYTLELRRLDPYIST